MAISWEAKRPAEVRDYQVDWSEFLGLDTIESQTLTASGVTIDSVEIDGDEQGVTAFLSGGTAGTIARLTNTIVTAGGRTESETIVLPIADKAEPVSVADLKRQCRIEEDNSDEDALLATYITIAREQIEAMTGQVLVRRTFTDHFECFGRSITLLKWPVIEIEAITYIDQDEAEQEYEDAIERLAPCPARIHPAAGGAWPAISPHGGVSVTHVSGYDEGEVPLKLCQAVLLLAAHYHANREPVVVGSIVNELPMAVDYLIASYRLAPC